MKKLKIIIPSIVLILIILLLLFGIYLKKQNEEETRKRLLEEAKIQEKKDIENNYNTFVRTNKETILYNSTYKKIGTISIDTYITLDDNYEIKDKYYKLKDLDYYVLYSDVVKCEEEILKNNEYMTYKNYIPFNENINTNDIYKIYFNDINYIELNEGRTYPIIIKEDNKYGIEFNNHLAYINKEDVKEVVSSSNSDALVATDLAVLNYHFTIDANSDERRECVQDICIPETQVDAQIKYLKDNGFYSTTMRDLYLFLNGKIQIPQKSVSITIDDGWYLPRMINILNKYEMNGTLFLIGSLASPTAYQSKYLEIHSHTWDLHTPGVCKGTHGGGILCLDENTILTDLKKSRESLDNTTVFCYPFYENNYRSKKLLKEAGFEMAFVGGNKKANQNNDIYLIPRYIMYDGLSMNTFINIVN